MLTPKNLMLDTARAVSCRVRSNVTFFVLTLLKDLSEISPMQPHVLMIFCSTLFSPTPAPPPPICELNLMNSSLLAPLQLKCLDAPLPAVPSRCSCPRALQLSVAALVHLMCMCLYSASANIHMASVKKWQKSIIWLPHACPPVTLSVGLLALMPRYDW